MADFDPKIDRFVGKYRFLSNFFVEKDGKTVEHRFQADKSLDRVYRLLVLRADNPREAKRLGRSIPLRSDWEQIKDARMMYYVERKFVRDTVLLKKLLETDNAYLIEGNSHGDDYWGCIWKNGDWVGKNKLGCILMDVRGLLMEAYGSHRGKL